MKYSRVVIVVLCFLMLMSPVFSDSGEEKKNLLQGTGSGTNQDPYIVPEATSHIKVDGKLEDSEWEKALKLNLLYESWPRDNAPARVRTECYLTYDKNNLYVGFRAFDPAPKKIRASYFERDNIYYDDFVLIFMDTFNDERRAYGIRSNPLGVQADSIRTRTNPNVEWDGIYKSVGQIYDWGYTVEMAIPFNQLRFQYTKEDQVWGINLRRLYPRGDLHHFDFIKTDRNNDCFMCQFIKVKGFKGARPGRNIEIVPALTFSRTDQRKSLPKGSFEKLDQDLDPALTAIWGISSNMTLSATVNPDFSQVEADALQLDINKPFALFFAERRPFFVEGAEYFSTLFSTVYTRTMRDPSWGLKVTGKAGYNTIGFYMVRDTLTNLIFPGSQGSDSVSLDINNISSVLRYKRDFGNKLTLGFMATDREGDDYYNRLVGFDGDIRFSQKDRLQWQFVGSSTRYPLPVAREFYQKEEAFGGTALKLDYLHDTRNLDFYLRFTNLSRGFRADLGYIPQVDYRSGEAGISYTWVGRGPRPGKRETWYRQLSLLGVLDYSEDQDGNLLTEGGILQLSVDGPMQSQFTAQLAQRRENYFNTNYDQFKVYLSAGIKPNRQLELAFTTIFGDQIDYNNARLGQRLLLEPYIILKAGRHLRLEFSHTYEKLKVDVGRLYTANVSQLTGTYHFNVRAFFRAVLQYVDYDFNTSSYLYPVIPELQTLFTQLLFSYEINPRTVLFLGYSDNYLGTRDFNLTQRDRSVFAKVSYALSL